MTSSAVVVADVLEWAEATTRDLPWRRTRDPWAVLVSEFMLQQTQVDRVVPKFETFMGRFPTPESCATADQADVVRLWAGLGYDRRARHLHQAARVVASSHCGRIPDSFEALLELPGVGPYTARAVLVFAFEHDAAVVDTNVGRVLARLHGRTLAWAEAQRLADALVPAGMGWTWNQAMLDLGATICRKRSPRCDVCPVATSCAWQGSGDDPAVGSAGTSSPQSRFEGSDRQGRARLVHSLRHEPLPVAKAGETVGWVDEPDRVARALAGLVADGLVVEVDGMLRLA